MTDLAAIRRRANGLIASDAWWGHYQAAAQDRVALLAEVDRLSETVAAVGLAEYRQGKKDIRAERARILAAVERLSDVYVGAARTDWVARAAVIAAIKGEEG